MPPSPSAKPAPAPAPKVAAPAPKVAPRPVAAPAPKAPARVAPAPAPVEEPAVEIDARLAEIEAFFGDSEEKTGFEQLPAGKYQVRIACVPNEGEDKIGINHSKNGRLQVTYECTVVTGQYKGRKVWKRDGLDTPESIGWFKGGLRKLGIDSPMKSASEIPTILEQLHNTYAEITVKHQEGSDFINAYWNKALDTDSVEAEGLETLPDAPALAAEGPITNVGTFSIGSKTRVNFDGTFYSGTVQSFADDGTTAAVLFEDGETQDIPVESLEEMPKVPTKPVAPKPVAAPAKAPVAAPVAKAAPAPSKPAPSVKAAPTATKAAPKVVTKVEVGFEESAIGQDEVNSIDGLAKAHSFNSNDYATWRDVLIDVAEFAGVTGTFDSPGDLIAAVQAVTPSA